MCKIIHLSENINMNSQIEEAAIILKEAAILCGHVIYPGIDSFNVCMA